MCWRVGGSKTEVLRQMMIECGHGSACVDGRMGREDGEDSSKLPRTQSWILHKVGFSNLPLAIYVYRRVTPHTPITIKSTDAMNRTLR
eukprot:scaffold54341_cov76-Cyclotella_meneghiniana.AAC.7